MHSPNWSFSLSLFFSLCVCCVSVCLSLFLSFSLSLFFLYIDSIHKRYLPPCGREGGPIHIRNALYLEDQVPFFLPLNLDWLTLAKAMWYLDWLGPVAVKWDGVISTFTDWHSVCGFGPTKQDASTLLSCQMPVSPQ